MQKRLLNTLGLSFVLLLGLAPSVVVGHEGHDHGAHHQRDDRDEDEETGRYDPSR